MTDTKTDTSLVGRLKWIASTLAGPSYDTIHTAIWLIERLERQRDAILRGWSDEKALMRKDRARAEAAETRLSRLIAPVEGLLTSEEERAPVRKMLSPTGQMECEERNLPNRPSNNFVERLLSDVNTLTARLRVAEETLEAYAKWEASVIREGWLVEGRFYMPRDLFDQLRQLQFMRDEALAALRDGRPGAEEQ